MTSPDTNLDPLVQEALKLIGDEDLTHHLLSRLPNDGQTLEDICKVGFAQYEKNAHYYLSECLRDQSS